MLPDIIFDVTNIFFVLGELDEMWNYLEDSGPCLVSSKLQQIVLVTHFWIHLGQNLRKTLTWIF